MNDYFCTISQNDSPPMFYKNFQQYFSKKNFNTNTITKLELDNGHTIVDHSLIGGAMIKFFATVADKIEPDQSLSTDNNLFRDHFL